MMAKVVTEILWRSLTALAGFLFSFGKKLIYRKKRDVKIDVAIKKVEDAKSHSDIVSSIDDIP